MNEFSLIDTYFKKQALSRSEVIFGIGDDAACVQIPPDSQLVISTDSLVAEVHFLSEWDAYDIAYKAVMVNVSDIAAMGADPCWMSLALTMPELNISWLERYSLGLHDALKKYNIALIGGDTTHGPLSMTLTIHGLVEPGKAVRRCGAKPGDSIWVSGELGLGAQAVALLKDNSVPDSDRQELMQKLLHPTPRVDLGYLLRNFASSAIDISDGLGADLNHICTQSGMGAVLSYSAIPVHPLIFKYQQDKAVDFALVSGDEYEICFTVPPEKLEAMKLVMQTSGFKLYPIGVIEQEKGMRLNRPTGKVESWTPRGYSHF